MAADTRHRPSWFHMSPATHGVTSTRGAVSTGRRRSRGIGEDARMPMLRAFLGGCRPLILAVLAAATWSAQSAARAVAEPETQLVTQGGVWPSVSATGRFVAYEDHGRIFLRDTRLRTTERIDVSTVGTPANEPACSPQVSAHGRYVIFASAADNLVLHDTNDFDDVFLR